MNILMNTTDTQSKHIDHEVVEFICRETNLNQRKIAWKVGEWLLVAASINGFYKIYRADIGKPLLNILFTRPEDALQIAGWINENFETYFDLWLSYPNADVFGLAKWSIRNGVEIYEIIKSIPPKVNSVEDIRVIETSKSLKDKVGEWYGRLIRRSA